MERKKSPDEEPHPESTQVIFQRVEGDLFVTDVLHHGEPATVITAIPENVYSKPEVKEPPKGFPFYEG